MKTTFLNWLQSQKAWITIIATLVLATSYSVANKPINWFVLFVIAINIHVTFNARRNLIRNDRNKNEKLKENDWQIFDEKGFFTFTLFLNGLLFSIFFIFAPHSVLEATILVMYLVLSVLYCLVRDIPILPIACTAVSIAILCLSPKVENVSAFRSLWLFFFAILFVVFGRGLIRNAKQSKNTPRSIMDVFQILSACLAIVSGFLLLSWMFFFYQEGLLPVTIFCFGLAFGAISCAIFAWLPKMKRIGIKALDGGILLIFIAFMFPKFLDRFDYFVYLFNQAVYSLNHYSPF